MELKGLLNNLKAQLLEEEKEEAEANASPPLANGMVVI